MTTTEFLSHIRDLGINLWLDGADLHYSAPAGALTQELRAELVARKEEILAFLCETQAVALPASDETVPEAAETYVAPRTPMEETLARIWGEVLGIEQVGIHDNFFELGGDSLLGMQVISRANQVGLRFVPQQLLQHQTVAELATVEGTDSVQAEQAAVTGVMPLTCGQSFLLRQAMQGLQSPHRWNLSQLLKVESGVSPTLIGEAVRCLWVHHDGLRIRFLQTATAGWQALIADPDETVPFTTIDLTMLPESERKDALETLADEVQGSLDLEDGPLFRVVLFVVEAQGQNRLLLLWHHLATDGYSNGILLQDLGIVCRQLTRGEPVRLPPKTTSLRQWSERLARYAQSDELCQELDYWLSRPWSQIPHLPIDYPEALENNTVDSSRHIENLSLDIEETQYLMRHNPGSTIENACLMALVCSITRWTGMDWVEIILVNSGRDISNAPDLDPSRTVGMFATEPVLVLRRPETDEPIKALESIEAQLREIPNRGRSYPVLANLGDRETIQKLNSLQKHELMFNYFGQHGRQEQGSTMLFSPASEFAGNRKDPRGRRFTVIAVQAGVREGRLWTVWWYSENVHKPATIERVAQDFIGALRSLVHCQSLEE